MVSEIDPMQKKTAGHLLKNRNVSLIFMPVFTKNQAGRQLMIVVILFPALPKLI